MAQAWFIAGAIAAVAAGGLHAVLALLDSVRPRYFAPVDASVKPAMEATTIRLGRMPPVGAGTRSMWSVWIGMNIAFGLALLTFGLLCLLIATHDFRLVEHVTAIRPIAIAFSAGLLAVSLRFFFYGPVVVTGTATACFTIATVV